MTLSPPHIVCAACRHENGTVVVGARHYDMVMHRIIEKLPFKWVEDEQGFIDQHGTFYGREEAYKVVLNNGQPFDPKRNGGNIPILFSEGLY